MHACWRVKQTTSKPRPLRHVRDVKRNVLVAEVSVMYCCVILFRVLVCFVMPMSRSMF